MPSIDSGLTPVKVRGKRHGIPAEKWRSGKRRKPALQRRSHQSTVTTSAPSSKASHKRHRRDGEEDSPLETLPAEVVQHIFEYSANINLPLVSRQLASKLSKSTHLEYQLTETLLSPVVRHLSSEEADPTQLAAATRLLNSRFMTFDFFKSWLRTHHEVGHTHVSDDGQDENWGAKWAALQPSPTLLPPRKLLSPPFTEAKSRFLAVLVQEKLDIASIDPAYGEYAFQGLQSAVTEGRRDVVSLMLNMGIRPNTELLRVAVIDSGCDQDIVLMLLDSNVPATGSLPLHEEVDLLDPPLWAWAEKARKLGDEKGQWLLKLLRERQQRKSAVAAPTEVSL